MSLDLARSGAQQDDFGSGIDLASQSSGQNTSNQFIQQAQAAQQAAQNQQLQQPSQQGQQFAPSQGNTEQNPWWNEFRGQFEGIPDGVTQDQFADHIVTLQTKADEAEALRQKIAELEARAAQSAYAQTRGQQGQAGQFAQQGQVAQQSQQQQPAEEEFVLPWSPVRVDPALRGLVTQDPNTGMFIPKIATSPAHIQAAEEMNSRLQYESRFTQDLFDDPQGTVSKLTRKELAALRKEIAAELEQFKTQFTPVQEHIKASQAQQQIAAFEAQNYQVLYGEDGQLSPIGRAVDASMRAYGMKPEDALKQAMENAQLFGFQLPNQQQLQQQQQPVSISKVSRRQQPQQDNRFASNLSPSTQSRLMAEKTDSDLTTTRRTPTLKDLEKKYTSHGN